MKGEAEIMLRVLLALVGIFTCSGVPFRSSSFIAVYAGAIQVSWDSWPSTTLTGAT